MIANRLYRPSFVSFGERVVLLWHDSGIPLCRHFRNRKTNAALWERIEIILALKP